MGKKFERLEEKIEHKYRKKGYGKKRSEYIAEATAGKIYRMKIDDRVKMPHEM